MHMGDPILPLQQLHKIVLFDVQLLSIRDNLPRCLTDKQPEQSGILNITFEVGPVGPT